MDNNNNNEYIYSVSSSTDDINNSTIFNIISSMLIDLKNNSNIFNNSQDENIVHFNIEFEYDDNEGNDGQLEEETNYFKNCNDINCALSKPTKIKDSDNILNESCLICIDNYKKGEFKRELPKCKHYFHKKCIDKWLKKKANCPICRDTLC